MCYRHTELENRRDNNEKKLNVLMVLFLVVSLFAGCSSPSSTPATISAPAPSSESAVESEVEVVESEVEEEEEAEEEDENNPYGLDYEVTGYQDMMKEGLLPQADLREAFEELEANAIDVMTYDEVIELIGIDPQEYTRMGNHRLFRWEREEDAMIIFEVRFSQVDDEWIANKAKWNG